MTRTSTSWLLEVHVDRRWYELRRSPEPVPAPGRPRVIALDPDEWQARPLLVGRGSASRPVDVDLRPDTGVSRRHAELQPERDGWRVLDLGSHNGTWLSNDPLMVPGVRLEAAAPLVDGSALYLGSWTRLVLRRGSSAALG